MVASSGATIYFHYCMNSLVGLGFERESSDTQKCPYCGMGNKNKHSAKKNKDCCNDKEAQVKIEKEHKASSFIYSCSKLPQIDIRNLVINHSFICSALCVLPRPADYTSPPEGVDTPIFMRNCVFLI